MPQLQPAMLVNLYSYNLQFFNKKSSIYHALGNTLCKWIFYIRSEVSIFLVSLVDLDVLL